jgi:hypothetical protein
MLLRNPTTLVALTGMVSSLILVASACGAADQNFVLAPRPLDRVASSPRTLATLAELRTRPVTPISSDGGHCPTTSAQNLQPAVTGGKAPGFGYGSGPVYLSGINNFYVGGFDNQLWLIEPTYAGPVLVRGRDVHGGSIIALEEPIAYAGSGLSPAGSLPPSAPVAHVAIGGETMAFYSELDLPSSSSEAPTGDWRMFFTRTHIEQPGCYELQIDGASFSSVVVIDVAAAGRPQG